MAVSAIVVGAGIGGLAAAVGLRRIGWDVTVLEQAPAIGEVGAGLSLWPNAVRCLDVLGVGDAVRAHAVPAVSRGGIRLPSGTWLRRARADDIRVLMVHRADLHRVLLDALPPAWLRVDATVTGVDERADGVTVTFQTAGGEQQESADLLISADGVDSTVRRLCWPAAPTPRFGHRTVWRAITEPGRAPAGESLTMGRGLQFGMLPLPGERVYWFLTAEATVPGLRYDDELQEVRRRLAGWHDPIPALLAATRPENLLHHDIVELGPVSGYRRGRVVLLGDAAHAQPPDLGQGACQALEDAVVLTAALAGQAGLPAALDWYDQQRRPRTQTMVRAALRQAAFNERHYRLVTLAARFTPPTAWRRRVAKWTEWVPPTWNADCRS
ncbi:FAD-dependent monooxygenase [Nonomuraea sp. B12E4]|uniref:FAD-dependent monooxygenase n=1 Tax=Nonomuraea sp. B12E4 TaxID=3153564 RepID=UPI00325F264C